MKAFILAAGYGTRLEPLTIAVPKPMVPIVNFPTIHHNLELLRKYGFCDIAVNVHYHPEQIENYFGDGNVFGVNLQYSYEEKLLGTAGGIKQMAGRFLPDDTFIVLSSDALTDINLEKLVEYHKKTNAIATLALSKVSDVSQFGVVLQDESGKISGFQEKPDPADALSDMANAGIYVFEPEILKLIPSGFYDFGRELFPRLVKEGLPIYGYQMVEYWNDVGDLEKYIRSNYDAMKGAVRISIPGNKSGGTTWIGERESIDASARFEGSVIVGDRCRIGKDVYIKDAVIGDKCIVEDGASIVGSVLWSDTIVGSSASITDAVIGAFCYICRGAKIDTGSVLANRCFVSAETRIMAASRLKPDSKL